MFFDSWHAILRVVIVGTAAYVAIVLFLRISGKRTLSKMNGFDFVVTIAMGSVLGSVVVSKDIVLADGLAALLVLILLQFIITWASVRSHWFQKIVRSEPSVVYSGGRFHRGEMQRQRVTESEVRSAVRAHGLGRVELAAAVILETDGSMTVIETPLPGDPDLTL